MYVFSIEAERARSYRISQQTKVGARAERGGRINETSLLKATLIDGDTDEEERCAEC